MEEQHYAARVKRLALQRQHPEKTHQQMAEATGYSVAWVRKWRRRFRAVANPEPILKGWPRTPHRRAEPLSATVIERILAIRDEPPENLHRVPGPKTILYYLQRDEALQMSGVRLPRSPRRVWESLVQHGRIVHPPGVEQHGLERAEPMTSWGIDFKDIATVQRDPDGEGKKQPVAETLDIIDEGTSVLVDNPVRGDFNAETVLRTLAETLGAYGLPKVIGCDRDPRFVGSHSGDDFPSAFIRFLACLGVEVEVCPLHRPDLNPFVERLHGSYDRECLKIFRPTDVEQAVQVTTVFKSHYNWERPNQALSCGNRPPRLALPELPPRPPLPPVVDPDRWLERVHGAALKRRVRADGTVVVDKPIYYIAQVLRGTYVVLQVDAAQQVFHVLHEYLPMKDVPIKGLRRAPMPFAQFRDVMCEQARSERRLYGRNVA
jgi:hypothetical protein